MKTYRKNAAKISYILSFAILLFSFILSGGVKVYAAGNPEPGKSCSVTFDIPSAYRDALKNTAIPVRLYRVAEVTDSGTYKDIPGYEQLNLGKMTADVTTGQLRIAAEEAAALLNQTEWKDVPDVEPNYSFEIVNNRGTQINMLSGLHLVCVRPTTIGEAKYNALPYLISLPTLFETGGSAQESDLNWIYDLTVDLKLASSGTPTTPSTPTNPTTSPTEPSSPTVPPTPTEPTSNKTHGGLSVKTGDDSKIPQVFALMILLGVVVAFSGEKILSKRRKCESES